MHFIEKLTHAQKINQTLLCIGLDPDLSRIPLHLRNKTDGIFEFCASIVDHCAQHAIAFKPQIAYFAAMGLENTLERLIAYIHNNHPNIPVILDAKRGDIGSTAKQYAIEAFERYQADALTLSPYMGFDSIEPYFDYPDKGLFLLCRTSNAGGNDLQRQTVAPTSDDSTPLPLYAHVASLAQNTWNQNQQLGLVAGATFPQDLRIIRAQAPTLPLLIPGIGAQGGDINETIHESWKGISISESTSFVIINASRSVLYASHDENFAKSAQIAAFDIKNQIQKAQKEVLNKPNGTF